ncbi:MAG: GAF domain-containing protein [Anaerolineaceae bacterium]|nr:GAF domain-containing protein [Anaerolineaceae bacterium]
MFSTPDLQAFPEWKQYLRLGEKLLDQPSVEKQCQLIQETIKNILGAEATIWLSEPYFPLPGDDEKPILPEAHVSEVVRQTFDQQLIHFEQGINTSFVGKNNSAKPTHIAIPLISQDNMLGVLEVQRTSGHPFDQREFNFLEGFSAHAAVSMQIIRQVILKNWRMEQISLVRKVSEQIANVHDLQTLCEKITDLIQRTFGYYFVTIFLLNGKTKSLELKASSSTFEPDNNLSHSVVNIGEGIVGHVAQYGKEIIANDVSKEALYKSYSNLPNTRSEATFPLKIDKKTLGVLDIQSNQLDAFRENDVIVLNALANSIAIAVQDAELYSSLSLRAEQISIIFEVSQTINSFLDLDELLEKIIQIIKKRFGFKCVHIFTVHNGRKKIFYQAGSLPESKKLIENGFAFELDADGIISWVAQNGIIAISNDIHQDKRFQIQRVHELDYQSELVVPLMYAGEVLGILDIQSGEKNSINEHDLFIFEAIASTISSALRNAFLFRSEQWRHRVAESFRSVISLISANTALDTLLCNILEKLNQNLPCDASAVWLLDNRFDNLEEFTPKTLSLAATWNISKEKLLGALTKNPETWGLMEMALKNNEPTIRSSEHPCGPLGVAKNFPNDYSSITTPLKIGDRILGLLSLAHHTSRRYGDEAREMSITFANYAAVAINNARIYAEAQEQAWMSTVMLQVSQACQNSETTEDLLESMVRLTPLLVGVKKCAFYLWNPYENYFFLKAAYGFSTPPTPVWTKDVPAAFQLLNSYNPIYIQDVSEELNFEKHDDISFNTTVLLLPMRARGDLLGSFLVFHENQNPNIENDLSSDTLSILQGIVQQTAVSLDNMRLIEARQEEAYITAVLLQVAQAVVTQPNLSDTFETIVNLLPILIGVNACIIYMPDDEEDQSFKPVGVYADNEAHSLIFSSPEFCENNPLLRFVSKFNQIAYSYIKNDEIESDCIKNIKPLPYIQELKIDVSDHMLIAFPINLKGELLGILLTKEDNLSSQYFEKRIELLNGVSQQISLAIQNYFLQKDIVKREKLEQEIQLARQIQKTFLPDSLPVLPGWQIQTRWEPALQVGGDFYDVIFLPNHRVGLVIADVADKGLAASLYMTVSRTLIRAFGQTIPDPGGILSAVNNLLVGDSPSGMFVTAIFAILDLKTGKLIFANAGHNRPIVIRSQKSLTEELPQGDMALGVMEDIQYRNMEFSIEPGDLILFYTDGLTETFSTDDVQYGVTRIIEFLKQHHQLNVNEILTKLDLELYDFREGEPSSDDLTLIGLKREILP